MWMMLHIVLPRLVELIVTKVILAKPLPQKKMVRWNHSYRPPEFHYLISYA